MPTANVIYPTQFGKNAQHPKYVARIQDQLARIGLGSDEGWTYVLIPESDWQATAQGFGADTKTAFSYAPLKRTYIRESQLPTTRDDDLARTLLHEYGHRALNASEKDEQKVVNWTNQTWKQIQKTNAAKDRVISATRTTPDLSEVPVAESLEPPQQAPPQLNPPTASTAPAGALRPGSRPRAQSQDVLPAKYLRPGGRSDMPQD